MKKEFKVLYVVLGTVSGKDYALTSFPTWEESQNHILENGPGFWLTDIENPRIVELKIYE